jgi:hypothetical protein
MKNAEEKIEVLDKLKGSAEYDEINALHNSGLEPLKNQNVSSSIKGRSNLYGQMRDIMESMGSKVSFEKNTFSVDNSQLSLTNLKQELFKKARATYYFIPPLLARFGEISLTYPGGCNL